MGRVVAGAVGFGGVEAVIFSGPYLYLYREFNPVNFR
jgi:hypothetical protein